MDLNYKELFMLICSGCDREKEVLFGPSVLEKSSYIVLNNAKSD